LNRRKFFQRSSASGAALLLASWDTLPAFQKPASSSLAEFRLKVLATNWGFNGTMDQFCRKAREEGYDGIEVWWPGTTEEQEALFAALAKYRLEVGFLCGGSQSDWQAHLQTFRQALEAASRQERARPLYINCHSGRDHFTEEQNQAFIDLTSTVSRESGITICHETHRGRMLFAAPITRKFIEKNPSLRITLDISHWCNVHESLLADQQENVSLALQRTSHIHARVGHPEGPQVSDPRAPEWSAALNAHIAWWDQVMQMRRQMGGTMTVLTEFGPPDYMWSLPYTRQPLADQWAINVHMMQLMRKRYA
jgi:sugar phosphate isomerase/epimerase